MSPAAEAQIRRSVPVAVLLVAAAIAAASGQPQAGGLIVLGVVVGLALGIDIDLPWGGQVPLGYTLLVAAIVLVEPLEAVLVLTSAAIGIVFDAGRRSILVTIAVGGAVAVLTRIALVRVGPFGGADLDVLVRTALIGGAFLGADLLLGRRHLQRVWPLYVTLLSAAALLAIAATKSPALGAVALVPLFVTKYSFGRFASARATYAQTTQALSLLPEVAGLSPLGHGERTALYARAVAERSGLDLTSVERVATAARLHHIGYISLHEPEERDGPPDVAELRRVSGELLRNTGFLSGIAEVVEDSQEADGVDPGLEAAIVQVCSAFDDASQSDSGADPYAVVVERYPTGNRAAAARVLSILRDRRPGLLAEGREASAVLAGVVSGVSDEGDQKG